MSRFVLVVLLATLSTGGSAQTPMAGRRDSLVVAKSGDIALAGLLAPARTEPMNATRVDNSGVGLRICAGGLGKWKCILGAAAVGFVAGALIGNALSPQEVDQTNYACSGFFGCGYYNECIKNCDEPVTKT